MKTTDNLRSRAEEKLAEYLTGHKNQDYGKMSPEDLQILIHELEVHQIELEMQNDELLSAQLALTASRDRYADLYDFSPIGYLTINALNKIEEANLTAATMLMWDRSSLIDQRLTTFIADYDQDHFYFFIKQLKKTKQPQTVELNIKKADGLIFTACLEGIVTSSANQEPGCRISLSDISDRRRAEEALRQSEGELRNLFSQLTSVILVLDAEGRYIKIAPTNPANPYRPSLDLLNKKIHDVFPTEMANNLLQKIRLSLKNQEVIGFEYHLNINSKVAWFDSQISPLTENTVFWIANDITEHKMMEEQLRQSQKLEAFGQLAGGIAHEFNNMLTIITGFTELLMKRIPPTDSKYESLTQIMNASQRSATLTQQLLGFCRKQIIAPVTLNLNEIITKMETILQGFIREDIQFTKLLEPKLEFIRMDPGQIEEIIINLVANARDAMPSGGTLTLTTANVELDEFYILNQLGAHLGPHVVLIVSDTGSGISPANLSRIFEPFFTTKEIGGGTGLGLAMVHGVITQNAGHIEVHSELGKGTTFNIYIPSLKSSLPLSLPALVQEIELEGNKTILLVEDLVDLRSMMMIALIDKGYNVIEAGDGITGLQIAENHDGPIHLLITDVIMPKMGGRLLMQQLKTSHPETKILFISGYNDDILIREGIQCHDAHFLQKPFAPTVLYSKIRQILDVSGVSEVGIS